jgi:hypothetical protein
VKGIRSLKAQILANLGIADYLSSLSVSSVVAPRPNFRYTERKFRKIADNDIGIAHRFGCP